MMHSKLTKNRLTLLIIGTAAVSSMLALVSLTKWSIWHDEGYSIMLAQYPAGELVQRTALDVHPPLYYLLLRGWGLTFGWSIVSLRLLSVLCATVAVALALLICHRLFGRRPTLILAPLLAVAPVITRYAQEVRMYAFAMCMVLIFLYAYILASKPPRSRKWLALMAVSGALLPYIHYFAALVLLVPIAIELRRAGIARSLRSLPASFLTVYAVIAVVFLPWVPQLFAQLRAVESGFWIGPVSTSSVLSTLGSFVFFRPEWGSWRLVQGWAVLAFALAAMTFLLVRRTMQQRRAVIVALGWLLPIGLLFVLSVLGYDYYYDRYFATFAPLYFMSLAVGLATIKTRRQIMAYALPLALMLAIGIYNTQSAGNNYGHRKGDEFSMKQLSGYIEKRADDSTPVIGADLWVYFDLRAYRVAAGNPEPLMLLDDLAKPPGKYGNGSLVYNRSDILVDKHVVSAMDSFWYVSQRDSDVAARLPAGFTRTDSLQVGYAKAELYKKQ